MATAKMFTAEQWAALRLLREHYHQHRDTSNTLLNDIRKVRQASSKYMTLGEGIMALYKQIESNGAAGQI